jgi:hypothetical protein
LGTVLQTQQVLKAYNATGNWDDIGNDKGILKIQIVSNPPMKSSLNSIFYATGDSEFVAKMKQEGKPAIKSNKGSDLFEIYKGSIKVVEISHVKTIIPESELDQAPKLPDDGRPQPEKRANKDPNTWKIANMKNPPTMFKVVDDKGINVADNFKTREGAQAYIDFRKVEPPKEPDIPDTPDTPPNAQQDKNGILLLFKPNGKEDFEPDHNFRNDGKRFDFNNDFAPAMDMAGYFKINKKTNDEISPKNFGGPHSEDTAEKARCYDAGINIEGNRVRMRIEHQHLGGGTGYTGNLEEEKLNLGNFVGRWVGVRYIGIHDGTSTRNIYLIDNKGLVNGKPANEWQVVADWPDTGQYKEKVKAKARGEFKYPPPYGAYPKEYGRGQQTFRIDTVGGSKDLEWYGLVCRQIDHTKPLTKIIKN